MIFLCYTISIKDKEGVNNVATKKSTKKVVKPSPKKVVKKVAPKKENKIAKFYTKDVSLVFAMLVEALILILGYLIIMSNV